MEFAYLAAWEQFQSSPALKDRCNSPDLDRQPVAGDVSILTGLERPVQLCPGTCSSTDARFQSSPALKDRCNATPGPLSYPSTVVSILTGLERPVQRRRDIPQYGGFVVSILTGLERPVQRTPGSPGKRASRAQIHLPELARRLLRPEEIFAV